MYLSYCLSLTLNSQHSGKAHKRVMSVTHEIDMADKKKRRRVFHVNMLRKWTLNLWSKAEASKSSEDEDEIPLWREEGVQVRPETRCW